MTAETAAALFRSNATSERIANRPAVRTADRIWTHADLHAEGCRWAQLLLERLPGERPRHVGVLLDNVPEYLFAFVGAALTGAAVVGLNHTRRGEHLARDIEHTHVGLIITEPAHLPLLEPIAARLPPVLVVGDDLDAALDAHEPTDPATDPDPSAPWALIFTSGTSSAPKAVICSQRRIVTTGARLAVVMGVGPDDVGYVAMPLFHSNSVMVGWAPSTAVGASVALARRFTVSGFLDYVRHFGATYFNYTGKPLSYLVATPERPDDADNPLRVAYGNEGSPQVVDTIARRFGVDVIDAFGATEGGVVLDREPPLERGAAGRLAPGVKIVTEAGDECPRARFDERGALVNAGACVGEIVNTAGPGLFEGYYNNPDATERTMRNGWYWSGDLGYVDDGGHVFFAGRVGDWLRVDGENFPAAPIETAVARHPAVVLSAVYGVPDDQAGDQVMVALVLRAGETFDPVGFAAWLDAQPDLGPKWRPRYLRLAAMLPTTGTNKVLTRALAADKFRLDRVGDDEVWVRDRGETAYRRFTAGDEQTLRTAFEAAGRGRYWEL
ncbi:MAG: AMP-binding protein [Acidimicrobiales bacterium]